MNHTTHYWKNNKSEFAVESEPRTSYMTLLLLTSGWLYYAENATHEILQQSDKSYSRIQ